jgi:hypothetical protein
MLDPNGEELLAEIERELGLIPEGVYEGEIIGFSHIMVTRGREQPYLTIGVTSQGHEMRCFLGGYKPALQALKCAEKFFTGKKVMVKITHRPFNAHMYHSPQILWDEAFEELNGL